MTTIVPIQDALKRTRPLRSPAQEAGLSLLRAADGLRRRLAAVVEPSGITLQQYNVLRILRGAGDKGLPTLAVGDRMIERTPGVTRLLDRLESDGFVARDRCSRDRRRVYACITDRGLALLARLDEPLAHAEDDVFADLTDDEVRTLIGGLARARGRIEAAEGASESPDLSGDA